MLGWRTLPVAISRFPQLLTLSWIAACTLSTLLTFVRSMWRRLVSSTYRMADRWWCRLVIGQYNLAPCPYFLCAPRMQILITAQSASDAPLPWVSPCALMLIPLPGNNFEFPNPIRSKNFMFSITPNIILTAVVSTPNAWNINNAIACAILS